MKTIEAVIVILTVALGASLVLNYSFYASNQQLSSSFSNLNQSFYNLNQKYNELAGLNASQSISMTNEPIGLNLRVAMNTTSLQSGQGIDVIISETNTLNTTNTVNASDNWQLSSLSLGPCTFGYPMGLAIFKGYYLYSNISTAESLDLYQPGIYYFCPAGFSATSFSFQPLSNMASVNEATNWSSSLPMTYEVTASGYWTDNYPLDYTGVNATFSNFQPGIYTVTGGDEWGQLVLLHFVVQGSNTTSGYCTTEFFDPPITYTFNNQTDGRLPDNYRGLYFGNDIFGMPNLPQGNSSVGTLPCLCRG